MGKHAYIAIFAKEDNGLYSVTFPDLPSAITQGDDITEALFMASDVLNLVITNAEQNGEPLPLPTKYETIKHEKNELLQYVICETKN